MSTLWKNFPMAHPTPRWKLGKLTPPPLPLENLIPSVGVVWIFSGTKHKTKSVE